MQGTHRRHERNLPAIAQFIHSLAQFWQGGDGLHGLFSPIDCDPEATRLVKREKAPPVSEMSMPHRIVFANEKGGTGKSTTAVHVAVALAYQGARVAALDLDTRQATLFRYCENRAATQARRNVKLPGPVFDTCHGETIEALEEEAARIGEDADFIVFDTPGRDDPFARHVAASADTLVTPMNDSFVDFDLIGQVDAESFKVRKLSFYSELIWEARIKRSRVQIEQERREMDWVVVRNRTGYTCLLYTSDAADE